MTKESLAQAHGPAFLDALVFSLPSSAKKKKQELPDFVLNAPSFLLGLRSSIEFA
jgi:hypothetical protein